MGIEYIVFIWLICGWVTVILFGRWTGSITLTDFVLVTLTGVVGLVAMVVIILSEIIPSITIWRRK
jgi:hypothetical protein